MRSRPGSGQARVEIDDGVKILWRGKRVQASIRRKKTFEAFREAFERASIAPNTSAAKRLGITRDLGGAILSM
jgi:ASC-1-like (ASCH) protein